MCEYKSKKRHQKCEHVHVYENLFIETHVCEKAPLDTDLHLQTYMCIKTHVSKHAHKISYPLPLPIAPAPSCERTPVKGDAKGTGHGGDPKSWTRSLLTVTAQNCGVSVPSPRGRRRMSGAWPDLPQGSIETGRSQPPGTDEATRDTHASLCLMTRCKGGGSPVPPVGSSRWPA